jgi:5-methylcytosine-specific restriction protein B
VAKGLPQELTDALETEKNIFSRILKNDYGRGGAWPWYWGAFYPKGGKRTEGAQLFASLNRHDLEFGFSLSDYGQDVRKRFVHHCKQHGAELSRLLRDTLSDPDLIFGSREKYRRQDGVNEEKLIQPPTWREWLESPGEVTNIRVVHALPAQDAAHGSEGDLIELVRSTFESLFPLVLLATSDDPLPKIESYLQVKPPPTTNPDYSLEQCAEQTGFAEAELARWVRAIHRKHQAVLYGPPGTGKTFIAEKLAKHLIGGGTGFSELVQFHPAYAYEDFIQGIRPNTEDGALSYDLEKGRFLDFCRRAGRQDDICVLIIDEINRANLARVFGELMYLLEYRNESVPLAGGGTLRVPPNVRIIGTMNTADRSIALVDHALRRRFAFLKLDPKPAVLRHYHERERTGFDATGLLTTLESLNNQIADPNYAVGVTFFLRKDLADQIEDIWRMEIEPYLEEFFFDQASKIDHFRWGNVKEKILR